jgi:hypothetical protein
MPLLSAEKGLSMYVIIGTCGGGVLLLIFVSLLIFHLRKRKKQSSRRNGKLALFRTATSRSNFTVETPPRAGTLNLQEKQEIGVSECQGWKQRL